jgi:hypothetical protein
MPRGLTGLDIKNWHPDLGTVNMNDARLTGLKTALKHINGIVAYNRRLF